MTIKIRDLDLDKRTSFETLVRSFIQKGYKEKAFKIVLKILTELKFRKHTDPLLFLNRSLDKSECRFELRVNKFSQTPKKQKGQPKLRGRLFYVGGSRVRRRAVKDLVKNSLTRLEDNMVEKVVEEISDMFIEKGVTMRKKREFYNSIYNARATIEVVKRHRRRKKINRL
jgi:ribosomal protein S7